jgi:DNA mismatch repair protein MutL
MALIQILPSALSDQIAAGEVVERPSSVAKELFENALDAGATRITVDFELGGVKRLRIVDNGSGMTCEDALLSVRRHATSKIGNLDDLNNLDTLGFRGEALASIASVSKFRIRTKQTGQLAATLVEVEGGLEPVVSEIGGPVGTEVIVEDLFFNVPARRKFLKKTQTEATHIVETAQRLALCYPTVAFKVLRDGKTVLDLPIHKDLSERLRGMFPASLTRAVKPLSVPGAFGLSGVIGAPEEARGSTRHYYLFVNGRIVKDRVMMSAIQSGCGHALSKGKHPFAVVSLTLPSLAVDVNVHPAKTEVRFADSRQIFRLIARTVESALMRTASSIEELSVSNVPRSVSGLEIKRLVEGSAKASQPLSPKPEPQANPEGLSTQKRRVFDAMARLAQKQHARGSERVPSQAHDVVTPGSKELTTSPTVKTQVEQTALFVDSTSSQKINHDATRRDVSRRESRSKFTEIASTGYEASQPTKEVNVGQSVPDDWADRSRCASLSQLVPIFQGGGLALFAEATGVTVLDVALLNQLIYRGRRRSCSFVPVELNRAVLIESSHAGRTQSLLDSLVGAGFAADAFGETTARVTGCDASIRLGDPMGRALALALPKVRTNSELEQCVLSIAAGVSADEWMSVLDQKDSHLYLDEVTQTLTSETVQ